MYPIEFVEIMLCLIVRACVRVCVCACVRACVRACVHICCQKSMPLISEGYIYYCILASECTKCPSKLWPNIHTSYLPYGGPTS